MKTFRNLITIGRQFGSGGKSIALEIGRILDIPVYDNELIIKAAEESGFSPELFKSKDEKRHFWHLGGIFGSNRYGAFTKNVLSEGELFKIQSDVIRKMAENGSAVFVGRASNYVLRDMDTLDVFISSPLDVRVKRVAERENITKEEAEGMVCRKERSRRSFYNFYTFGAWGDAATYDLCLDSSLMSVEECASLIIEFGRKSGKIK